jgi:hypothetical protein
MSAERPRRFIVAGMPRTATTFLYQRFQEHPEIFCPFRKETNYFSVNFRKGPDWYDKLYEDMPDGQIGADVSPVYFLDDDAIERISTHETESPIILGVRPASEWALSWYTQVLSNHIGEKPSFEEFVTGYMYQISGGEIWQDFRNGFVQRMVERYQDAFGDRLLIYHFRALRENPLGLINSIEELVGVQKYFCENNLKNEIVNAGARRNIGFIAYILGREGFVEAVGRLLPRQLVQTARNVYVRLGTNKKDVKRTAFTDEEIRLAKEIFADDDRWIEEVFAESSIQFFSTSNAGRGGSGKIDQESITLPEADYSS